MESICYHHQQVLKWQRDWNKQDSFVSCLNPLGKKDFHISHESGSGNGVDTRSKVPDEQLQNTFGIDEGTGTIPGVPDVPIYDSQRDKESWGDIDEEDDDKDDFEDDVDINDDDSDDNNESDDERTKSDSDEIPNPYKSNDEHDEEEEEYDDELNFEEEKDLSELKQVDQYAQALSFIHAIVNRYMDNKLGEAINKAIHAHNFNCREEAQAEKRVYIELVDSTMRTIIKKESLYEAVATLFDFELTKILVEELRRQRQRSRPLRWIRPRNKKKDSSKDVVSSRDSKAKEKKSSSISKGASQSQHKFSSKFAHAEDPSYTV
nr:hypothetical protein [Tanacetum cinerariifolium]GEY78777.1 hypothetical protein [Tanacetum cinerariifolium]